MSQQNEIDRARQVTMLAERYVGTGPSLRDALDDFEAACLRAALARCDGNQSRAAQCLGVHRNTIGKRLRDLAASLRRIDSLLQVGAVTRGRQ